LTAYHDERSFQVAFRTAESTFSTAQPVAGEVEVVCGAEEVGLPSEIPDELAKTDRVVIVNHAINAIEQLE